MNTTFKSMALAGLLALAGTASAGVTVTFHPENYHDMPFATWDRDEVLKELSDHFAMLSKKLPPGQDLRIEVLDLDLAGQIRHNFRGGNEIRVLNGRADWPRMVIRYSVESNGQVINSGEDQLRDMMYLDHSNPYFDGEPLRYEKRMIDDWFKQKFGVGRHG